MKNITNISIVARSDAAELNKYVCDCVSKCQLEGKEVDIQFSMNGNYFGAMIIASVNTIGGGDSNNEQE